MKIVFLDFDGVICTSESIRNSSVFFNEDNSGDKNLYHIKMIDPNLVSNLNKVISATDAKIVISSTWRYSHPLKELKDFLRITGFIGNVIDRIPLWKEYKNEIGTKTTGELKRFWEYERGNEIKMWLDKHSDVESFLIIDDELSDIIPIFPNNYIQTGMERGFHEGLIQEAIDKLNKGE